MKALFFITLCVALALAQTSANWRSFDGTGNNAQNPTWGSTNTPLLRKGPAVYGDACGYVLRKSVSGQPLPSGRYVSNIVHIAPPNNKQPLNKRGLTDYVTYWGQFMDHDLDLTGGPKGSAVPAEPLFIAVPAGDPFFDPLNYGNQSMVINRSIYVNGTSCVREQLNLITSFMDGSQIYGSDPAVAAALRTMSGGLLRTTSLPSTEVMPPLNTNGITNANDAHVVNDTSLYILGDVRGNENPALTSLHTIFIREHNRRAAQLAALNNTWNDEQLYQEARRWNIALLQQITFAEYLPVTLGGPAPAYNGYNSSRNPGIYTEFSSGSFRYGHSEVSDSIWRVDANGTTIPEGHLALKNAYFNSPNTLSIGVTPILRGMAAFTQNAVDNYFVDALRNFLFGAPGAGGLDLAAVNIERSRDHGLAGFNDFRAYYGLPRYTNWSQIHPDPNVYSLLAQAYTSIDDCDVYTCGLAEAQARTANVGPTFVASIRDQYATFRDGDRFWYEAAGQWSAAELTEIKGTTLSDVIVRNSPIKATEIQCFVMAQPDGCGRPVNPVTGYDFVLTLQKKTAAHPYFGKGSAFGYKVNGVEGANMTMQRGKTYTIYSQISCAHPLKIVTAEAPGSPLYTNVANQFNCLHQDPVMSVTLNASTADALFYHCDFHAWMGGRIIVVDPPTSAPSVPVATTAASSQPISGTSTFVIAITFIFALIAVLF